MTGEAVVIVSPLVYTATIHLPKLSGKGDTGSACYFRAMRARLIAAFAAVYLIWGSTYLAIRFAVQTLPPLLMASARFVIAGAIVLVWARMRDGAAWPSRVEWRVGLIGGALLLLGGNGGVSWA